MMNKYILFVTLAAASQGALAQNTDDSTAVKFDALYCADVVSNVHGGIEQGTRYLGNAHVGADFSLQRLLGWKGGVVRACVANTHGGCPSADLIGDVQVVSNIEAGNHTFLHELWWQQNWNSGHVRVGLQDLNEELLVCEYAANFMNSSFGTPSIVALNFSAPIYPIDGLGLNAHMQLSKQWSVHTALFDGNVIGFDENPHNLKWSISPDKGILMIAQADYETPNDRYKGFYNAGVYWHTELQCASLYANLSQTIWQGAAGRTLQTFSQLSATSRNSNDNIFYWSAGVNMDHPFCANDWLGFGVAYAGMKHAHDECTLELSYQHSFNDWLYVKPDVQYIFHPYNDACPTNNALVLSLRVGIEI